MMCKDCYPCCDHCSYAKFIVAFKNGEFIRKDVDGCSKHPDEHHQWMARGLGYCKDFKCFEKDGQKEE